MSEYTESSAHQAAMMQIAIQVTSEDSMSPMTNTQETQKITESSIEITNPVTEPDPKKPDESDVTKEPTTAEIISGLIGQIGHETFAVGIPGAKVISCHNSNDIKITMTQLNSLAQLLALTPERVYYAGDNNWVIRHVTGSRTAIELLDKETNKVSGVIEFGRVVILGKSTVPTTVKVRWWTNQSGKDLDPKKSVIDRIIFFPSMDEQEMPEEYFGIDDWVEEYGVKIESDQGISATYPTDHRTACASFQGMCIKTKNLCGESDASPSTEVVSGTTSESEYSKRNTYIFEFLSGEAYKEFNEELRELWEELKTQVTTDLGPITVPGSDEGPKTFKQCWLDKHISDKEGLRSAGWCNIHDLAEPSAFDPSSEAHRFASYLREKFEVEYTKWEKSPKTTPRARELARYWIHFKSLVMSKSRFQEFIHRTFEEIVSVTKITMEQDLELEMTGQLAHVICLQEVSKAKHIRLTAMVPLMAGLGYTLCIPPYESFDKTCGAIIVRSELIDM